METTENNWTTGTVVTLPRKERQHKKGGLNSYEYYIASRYVCIREAKDGQRGILLKVLGKVFADQVKIVGGKPFTIDDYEELFDGHRYGSYPFPTALQVSEAVSIFRQDTSLLQKLEEAKMHLNPNGKFWVDDTTRSAFFTKVPQVYNASNGQLNSVSDDTPYYRITMVYFDKEQLLW